MHMVAIPAASTRVWEDVSPPGVSVGRCPSKRVPRPEFTWITVCQEGALGTKQQVRVVRAMGETKSNCWCGAPNKSAALKYCPCNSTSSRGVPLDPSTANFVLKRPLQRASKHHTSKRLKAVIQSIYDSNSSMSQHDAHMCHITSQNYYSVIFPFTPCSLQAGSEVSTVWCWLCP